MNEACKNVNPLSFLLEECHNASRKDLSSLSNALSNLITFLETNQKKPRKSLVEIIDDENDISDEFERQNDLLNIASSLLKLEIIRTGTGPGDGGIQSETERYIQLQIDQCLDRCGLGVTFNAALGIIQSISSSKNNNEELKHDSLSPSSLIPRVVSSAHVVKRLLLQIGQRNNNNNDGDSYGEQTFENILFSFLREYFNLSQGPSSIIMSQSFQIERLKKQIQALIQNVVILLPSQIANAFHFCKLSLPMWIVRSKFYSKVVESAAYMTMLHCSKECEETEHMNIGMIYLSTLVEVLVRHGSADDVVRGMHHFWSKFVNSRSETEEMNNNDHEFENARQVVHLATIQMKSPRYSAIFIRSCIRFVISQIESCPNITMDGLNAKSICMDQCMPFLRDACLDILSSETIRDAFVDLLILSPLPNDDLTQQKLITRCVVELISSCQMGKECDSINEIDEDDDYEEVERGQEDNMKIVVGYKVLMKHVLEVCSIWNEIDFVNQTDRNQQSHISSFIIDAIDYMQQDNMHGNTLQQAAVQEMVVGVTNRLKVSDVKIRVDGMMVAEKIAPILGETLAFDELDAVRQRHSKRQDRPPIKQRYIPLPAARTKTQERSKKSKKKKTTVKIDPDEEYLSDESSTSSFDSGDFDNDSESCDSDWKEENLISYNLTDDEEDLRPFSKPVYLRECLDYLRASNEDDQAKYMHEVGLEEISKLVRASPPDLLDIAESLTVELLHVENKYNLDSFTKLRLEGLCSLAACAPIATIPCLQKEIFLDVAFEVRLEILEVMKYSAAELCGQRELEKHRLERASLPIVEQPKIMGKRSIVPHQLPNDIKDDVIGDVANVVKELKTRRWGRSRHPDRNITVSNRFGELSSLYFYPLIRGFAESKTREALWGGENGGRLLSRLIITLSTFVENSGNHPGTPILASDLLELSLSFYEAENPELRVSALVSIATCLPSLSHDVLARFTYEEKLPLRLSKTMRTDSNKDCRQLAKIILSSLSNISSVMLT